MCCFAGLLAGNTMLAGMVYHFRYDVGMPCRLAGMLFWLVRAFGHYGVLVEGSVYDVWLVCWHCGYDILAMVWLVWWQYFFHAAIELVALWLVCCGCDAGVSAVLFGG